MYQTMARTGGRIMALIYIVEDDKNISEIESYALKNSGYLVDTFENAKTFWSRVQDRKPDLVLLDVMLPDSDGIEVLKKNETKSRHQTCTGDHGDRQIFRD